MAGSGLHARPMTTTDHRSALHQSYEHAATIVAGVRPEQLGLPTPCPDYDVAALVDHLVGAGHRAVALAGGGAPGGDEFPHVELAEAVEQLRAAGKESASAWADDATLERTVTMPWGETYTGRTLADMYLGELAAHAWDLARATGQLDRIDGSLGTPALEAARSMLKPEYRDAMGPGSPFGAEVPAPEGATDYERFVAFMGRDPR